MLIFSLIRYTRKWHRGLLPRRRGTRMPGENVAAGVTFQLMCSCAARVGRDTVTCVCVCASSSTVAAGAGKNSRIELGCGLRAERGWMIVALVRISLRWMGLLYDVFVWCIFFKILKYFEYRVVYMSLSCLLKIKYFLDEINLKAIKKSFKRECTF